MPGRRARRSAQPSPARVPAEAVTTLDAITVLLQRTDGGLWKPRKDQRDPEVECAIQLRRIGDKLNFRQKLVNLISKLLRSGT